MLVIGPQITKIRYQCAVVENVQKLPLSCKNESVTTRMEVSHLTSLAFAF